VNRSHWRRPIAALVPILIALLAFGALPAMRLAAQGGPNPNTSDCDPNLLSSVNPEAFSLGQTAQVQLTMNMSCPDYRLPIDLVFLVDVSNSMTRGKAGLGSALPTTSAPGVPGPGTTAKPPVEPPVEPPIEPPIEPPVQPLQAGPIQTGEPAEPPGVPVPGGANAGRGNGDPPGCEQAGGSTPGGAGGGGSTLPKLPTVEGPKTAIPEKTAVQKTAVPGEGTRPPGSSATPGGPGGAGNDQGGQAAEPAGTEDLIREAKEFIRDFVDQPQIQQDLSDGTLRLGLVAFSDRGRRLMSLTNEGNRVTGRLSLLRGSGRTRIDLGMRTAEAVLLDRNNARRADNDADRTKVVVVLSDGAFCARDLRVKVDKRIEVMTLGAGRGPYTKNLRAIATDLAYALKLQGGRALKDTQYIYTKDFVRTRPVTVSTLEMTAELEPSMQIVDGSVNPAGTVDMQIIKWTAPAIDWTTPVTLTYGIRPQSGGLQNVNHWAHVTWKDSEKRDGQGVFPALYVDVAGPTATATSEIVPTATPELPPELR